MRPEYAALLEDWPRDLAEARVAQEELAGRVEVRDRFGEIRVVAGADVSYIPARQLSFACVALLEYPALTLVEQACAARPTEFPYVPGFLSFREIPVIVAALDKLSRPPDLFLCDGQGVAHPRRLGLASHLGALLDIPSVGVAKSRLVGRYAEPENWRGDWSPLLLRGEILGAVLRTRPGVKPVFVSPGHRVSLETAISFTLACTPRYRLPETTRLTHNLAAQAKIFGPEAVLAAKEAERDRPDQAIMAKVRRRT